MSIQSVVVKVNSAPVSVVYSGATQAYSASIPTKEVIITHAYTWTTSQGSAIRS